MSPEEIPYTGSLEVSLDLVQALKQSSDDQRKRAIQQGADSKTIEGLNDVDVADFRGAQKGLEDLSHILFGNPSEELRAALRAEVERLFDKPQKKKKGPSTGVIE